MDWADRSLAGMLITAGIVAVVCLVAYWATPRREDEDGSGG